MEISLEYDSMLYVVYVFQFRIIWRRQCKTQNILSFTALWFHGSKYIEEKTALKKKYYAEEEICSQLKMRHFYCVNSTLT